MLGTGLDGGGMYEIGVLSSGGTSSGSGTNQASEVEIAEICAAPSASFSVVRMLASSGP
jgi:hypothetical protein